jgi:hypothetical protein
MKSHSSSHHVLKSLAELSPEWLEAEAAAHEKRKHQKTQAPMQETKQHAIQPSYPIASDTRGYRGWGIND